MRTVYYMAFTFIFGRSNDLQIMSSCQESQGRPRSNFAVILIQQKKILLAGYIMIALFFRKAEAKKQSWKKRKDNVFPTKTMEIVYNTNDYMTIILIIKMIMKNTFAFLIFLWSGIFSFGQEIAKEEVGNTEYLNEQIVDKKLEDLRLKRQKQLLAAPSLMERGETHTYSGEYLEAIEFPVGAFGGGHILLDGTGQLKHWKIFNNHNLAFIPHSFFAARVKPNSRKPVVRALQTHAVEAFPAMEKLTFQGEYPFANMRFSDSEFPVDISMEVFNPFIPMQLKNSSIPCAIFMLSAENNSNEPVEVGFLYAQQNAVGYFPFNRHGPKNSSREFFENDTKYINLNAVDGKSFENYGGNINRIHQDRHHTYVHLTKNRSNDSLGYGDMTIGLVGEQGEATADWQSMEALYDNFYKTGSLVKMVKTQPSPKGETVDAAVSKTFWLKPGEKRSITFYLTWHFPFGERGSYSKNSWGRGQWGGDGNRYTHWWKNSKEVADYLQTHFKELHSLTKLYHNSFYQSNFPHWLKDRITAQTSILKTNTMFWDNEGYIGGWEGISPRGGACSGNCTHVWHYAQAHARLFPEIGRKMREQSFRYMKENGMIPYRHPNGHEAFDGQCGEILQVYREHLTGTDFDWLNVNYPKTKKAMDFIIKTWDPDEDGILEGAKHNTLDSRLGGNSAWHGSLYAAALSAMAEMALLQKEPEIATHYNQLSKRAIDSHLETLWNGEYFIQIPDSVPRADFLTGCATDQMLGQWWANQLQLGSLYPEDILDKTMESIFKYNFKANFEGIKQTPREFAKPDEAGLLMITWPKGGRPKPHTSYADEVMSGFEYAAAATMIASGNLKEGLTVVKAVSDRYTGKLKVGYGGGWGNWGYSGNPFGDDECGKFYSRAMSSWSVLLALQGFSYNGPEKMIGFDPVWQPEDHVSFFTTAEGWGRFTQKRSDKKQTNTLSIDYGNVSLSKIDLKARVYKKPIAILKINGEKITSQMTQNGNQYQITWPGTNLKAGDEIEVLIKST